MVAPKKTAKKVKAVKKIPAKASSAKKLSVSIKKPLSKSQIISTISEHTLLKRKEVADVFDGIIKLIELHLKKGGPGEFNLPGVLKCRVVRKPATKARKGVNPFTGEEMMFKAKPARNVVKIRPLKKLKEIAA